MKQANPVCREKTQQLRGSFGCLFSMEEKKMMNLNEGVASRYGIREAVIAQHLWDIGENTEYEDVI